MLVNRLLCYEQATLVFRTGS